MDCILCGKDHSKSGACGIISAINKRWGVPENTKKRKNNPKKATAVPNKKHKSIERKKQPKLLCGNSAQMDFGDGILYKGDCVEVMKTLDEKSVDICVTSPPYNAQKAYEKVKQTREEFFLFQKLWLEGVFRLLKDGGKLFLNIGWWCGKREKRFFLPSEMITIAVEVGFKLSSWINWVKGSLKAPQAGRASGDIYGVSPFFSNGDEPILYFTKGKRKHENNKHENWYKWTKTPWVFPTSRNKEHPATFPLELPLRCIKMTSVEGWTVLDPFGGSGTTALAARKLKRRFILIEKQKSYCELIHQKLS